MDPTDIAAALRQFRHDSGLTRIEAWMQLKLAAQKQRKDEAKWVVSDSTIRNWESNRTTLYDMSKVLFYCEAVYGKRFPDLDAEVARQRRLRTRKPNASD